ncbi:hypothetical protein [Demequina oxidasica]|uniref:hypothetical protein n=1 Tax=Demequina oxidasica TaxID=676199 RepID=UPI000784D7CF|nr:hypothetical protein [Demequina oxidasica]
MKTSTPTITLTVAISVALGLTACSSDAESEPTPSASPITAAPEAAPSESVPAEPETAAPVESESAAPAPAPAGDGSVTAPGTELAYGDTAVVPWTTYSSETPIELNVTIPEPRVGELSDFDGLGLDEDTLAQIQGYTPYYVDFDIQKANLDEGEIAFSAAYTEIGAVNSDGGKIPDFTIIGDFETCDTEGFGSDADTGAVTSSCSIFLVPSGQEFGGATWDQYDTEYDDFDGEPILWTS